MNMNVAILLNIKHGRSRNKKSELCIIGVVKYVEQTSSSALFTSSTKATPLKHYKPSIRIRFSNVSVIWMFGIRIPTVFLFVSKLIGWTICFYLAFDGMCALQLFPPFSFPWNSPVIATNGGKILRTFSLKFFYTTIIQMKSTVFYWIQNLVIQLKIT